MGGLMSKSDDDIVDCSHSCFRCRSALAYMIDCCSHVFPQWQYNCTYSSVTAATCL